MMAREERGMLDRLNPFSQVRERWDNARAHPVQTGVSTVLGLLNPALGMGSRAAFNRYNDRRFDNSAQRNNARVGEMGDAAAQDAMGRSPWDAPTGENSRADLVNALMGGSPGRQQTMGPGNYGGQQALNSGGYNVQSQWAQQQPQSILGAMPQSPMPQLDLTGLDAALAARGGQGQGSGGGSPGAGWSGVMGPGANGQALIRGTQQFGASGAGGASKFYRRGGSSAR